MEQDFKCLKKENVILSILKLKVNRKIIREEDTQRILNKILRTNNLAIDPTNRIEDAHLDTPPKNL